MTLTILPLNANKSGKFIPWMIALMVYLAIIAALGAVSMSQWASRWSLDLSQTFTVELPPLAQGAPAEKIEAVLNFLQGQEGIASVDLVDSKQVNALLKPWFGNEFKSQDFPLPILIDGHLKSKTSLDLEQLKNQLQPLYAGALVESNAPWQQTIGTFARSMEWGLFLVLGLILVTVVGAINFITKTGLIIHEEIISILQLVGARDDFVAKQFQRFILNLGVKGCLYGMTMALLTAVGLYFATQQLEGLLKLDLSLGVVQGIWFLAIPAVVLFFMVVATRRTVLKTLRTKLPA